MQNLTVGRQVYFSMTENITWCLGLNNLAVTLSASLFFLSLL